MAQQASANDGSSTATLGYATPRVLFDRPFRHRSWYQTFAGVAALAAGAFFLFMGRQMPPVWGPFPFPLRLVMWAAPGWVA